MKKFNEILGKKRTAFWITFGLSALLIITSFFIPPVAVIDSSVIAAVGELAGFYSLYLVGEAINKGKDAKITKGDVSVEISNSEFESVE